jgi:hypothetical protein
MNLAILAGQARTRVLASDSAVTVLASDDFWHRISGPTDFRTRRLRASTILAWLVKKRSADEAKPIKEDARAMFGDEEGRLNLEALAELGDARKTVLLDTGLLDASTAGRAGMRVWRAHAARRLCFSSGTHIARKAGPRLAHCG